MSTKKFLNFAEFVNEKYVYRKDSISEDTVPGAAPDNTPAPVGGQPPAQQTASTPTSTPAPPLMLNFNNDFQSGKWKLDGNQSAKVMSELSQIDNYINSNASSQFIVTINSGESQVPNRDADAPKGPDGQFPRLQPGQLATNRANAIKAILDQYLASLKAKGVNVDNIKVDVAKPVIGTTPWKEGANANDLAYVREQFVNLTIKASGSNPESGGIHLEKYATNGEVVRHPNGYVLGTIHYVTSQNGSGTGTGTEPAVIRLADANGKYTNKFVPIPGSDVQKYFGTTNTLSNDQAFNQLAVNAQPVPQNDPLFGKDVNAAALGR